MAYQTDTLSLQERVKRLKRTLAYIEISPLRQVRLMFGTIDMLPICDEIYPIADIKKEYLRRLKYRIIESENELNKLKTQNV